MVDTKQREVLRMELLARGAALVYGQASGAGDSADTFECRAYGMGDRFETYTKSGTLFYRVWKDGKVVEDKATYYRFGPDDLPDFIESEDVDLFYLIDLPADTQSALDKLLDAVCDSEGWWHFNDDGSRGEFFWLLEANKAAVIGCYYCLETHPMNNDDPLNIEKEALE